MKKKQKEIVYADGQMEISTWIVGILFSDIAKKVNSIQCIPAVETKIRIFLW